MDDKISGLVYESVSVREGKDWEGNDAVEFKFYYSHPDKNITTGVVVLDREAAKDLAFHLFDLFLYGGFGNG